MTKSTVGVRCTWTCAKCGAVKCTHHLEFLGPFSTVVVAPPPGWSIHEGAALCGGAKDAA